MAINTETMRFFAHAKHDQKIALSTVQKENFTFGELAARVNEVVTQLSDRVQAGSVLICAEKTELVVIAVIACLKLKLPVVVIDRTVNADDVAELVEQHHVRLSIGDTTLDQLPPTTGRATPRAWHPSTTVALYTRDENGLRTNVFAVADLQTIFSDLTNAAAVQGNDHLLIVEGVPFAVCLIDTLWALAKYIPVVIRNIHDVSDALVDEDDVLMDFSLFYFGSSPEAEQEDDKYALVKESVIYGDAHGYSAVWTPERHFNAFGGLFPNPSVLGAALAMITKNVQIRTGSIVSPLHHPIRIAEDWAVIDNLSQGRGALSFASGWQLNDFVFYPDHYANRHQVMLKQIEDVRTLWAGQSIPCKNGVDEVIDVRIFPRPVQTELPIWITVSGKTESFVDAGKLGANILTHLLWQDPDELIEKIKAYRASLRASGFDPASRTVSVMVHTFVGLDDDNVRAAVREPLKEYIKSSVHLIETMTKSSVNSSQTKKDNIGRYGHIEAGIQEDLFEELLELAFNRFFENAALLGSPERCHNIVKKLKGYGVTELACLIDFGLAKSEVMESLKHLTQFKHAYSTNHTNKFKVSLVRCSEDHELRVHANSEGLRAVRKIMVSHPSFYSVNNRNDVEYPSEAIEMEKYLAAGAAGVLSTDDQHAAAFNALITDEF
ncbi:MupA/Atu3671 family FMN-dependent luciferase-like monooxygenase [Chryseolinea lacunae]|uniref:LLM class flavin-dependent oxidoreductase n=1 Tax=Chryseolinea lacunae TaxID=2801331 RepID=A0ABS1KUV1_9BACT|nr:MupA/Atu3671 family FMN-dependent luciferase-like monooxygenase [Chryseolinea lacunae]MBL0743078.1 LLM class flavin-dependent oxidoreductase [Chryseolinea lacunae]